MAKKRDIENWADKQDSDVYQQCTKFYDKIQKQYENQREADESVDEYWNIYNATPDENQSYQGNSQCYVPAVRDAIKARARRVLKQTFPVRYKHVEAICENNESAQPQLAILEHYIRTLKLKSLCRSMLISGDVTGQWGIYVDWFSEQRTIQRMIKKPPIVEKLGGEVKDTGEDAEEEEEIKDEELTIQHPEITDFATEDLAVIPPTCNDIEKAELVALKMRLDKDSIRELVDAGIFIIDGDIAEWMETKEQKEKRNPDKNRAEDAGVKTSGTGKLLMIYEVTARLEFEEGKKQLAYIYYAGPDDIIGIIKAPQWGQKRPILSAPVERIKGSFRGISSVEAVKYLQWNLNDFWNMGQDSGMYAMLPITMTDPAKNPNYAMMVYGLAAVWPVDPNSTKFASMPALWKDAVMMCQAIEARINQTLDVNDMMMGRPPPGRKNNAAVGQQMQEASVSVTDQGDRFEEEILTPLMERLFEYDCQFRDKDITVLTMGSIGVKATMMTIPPQEWGQRIFFQWWGTEYVMNMQRLQQQIATMNVLRGINPQQLNGLKLDISPILLLLCQNIFGSTLSEQILVDDRNKFTVDPTVEDEMMVNGILVEVHEADDDMAHIQAHQQAGQMTKDGNGLIRTHIQAHMMQLQKKRQMQMGAVQGQPGVPGAAGQPGVPGTPRPGAIPQGPRPVAQQPAGAIHPDQMLEAGGARG